MFIDKGTRICNIPPIHTEGGQQNVLAYHDTV